MHIYDFGSGRPEILRSRLTPQGQSTVTRFREYMCKLYRSASLCGGPFDEEVKCLILDMYMRW